MKRTSLLLLLPALLLSTACERHTASSLPAHGEHSAAPYPVAGAEKTSVHVPSAAEKGASEATPAPKFFENKAK